MGDIQRIALVRGGKKCDCAAQPRHHQPSVPSGLPFEPVPGAPPPFAQTVMAMHSSKAATTASALQHAAPSHSSCAALPPPPPPPQQQAFSGTQAAQRNLEPASASTPPVPPAAHHTPMMVASAPTPVPVRVAAELPAPAAPTKPAAAASTAQQPLPAAAATALAAAASAWPQQAAAVAAYPQHLALPLPFQAHVLQHALALRLPSSSCSMPALQPQPHAAGLHPLQPLPQQQQQLPSVGACATAASELYVCHSGSSAALPCPSSLPALSSWNNNNNHGCGGGAVPSLAQLMALGMHGACDDDDACEGTAAHSNNHLLPPHQQHQHQPLPHPHHNQAYMLPGAQAPHGPLRAAVHSSGASSASSSMMACHGGAPRLLVQDKQPQQLVQGVQPADDHAAIMMMLMS